MLDAASVWAIVPMKPLVAAKSRLAGVLSPAEREAICLRMLGHVLDEISAARGIGNRAVVSPDDRVLALARERGAVMVRDSGLDLNEALRQAVGVALGGGARAVLLLPADLPLLMSEELDQLVDLVDESPCVAIARAEGDGGTNALLVRPPGALAPAFGPNSFEVHCRRARELGIPVRVCDAPGLALDLDTPETLAALAAMRRAPLGGRQGSAL